MNASYTPPSFDKLYQEYGREVVDDYYERIKDWEANKRKKYKNYPAAIRNWLKRDGVKKRPVASVVVAAPSTDSCPSCSSPEVRQNIDELVCRFCGRYFKWKEGRWMEDQCT